MNLCREFSCLGMAVSFAAVFQGSCFVDLEVTRLLTFKMRAQSSRRCKCCAVEIWRWNCWRCECWAMNTAKHKYRVAQDVSSGELLRKCECEAIVDVRLESVKMQTLIWAWCCCERRAKDLLAMSLAPLKYWCTSAIKLVVISLLEPRRQSTGHLNQITELACWE